MGDYTRGDDPAYNGYREAWASQREDELEREVEQLQGELDTLRAEIDDLNAAIETRDRMLRDLTKEHGKVRTDMAVVINHFERLGAITRDCRTCQYGDDRKLCEEQCVRKSVNAYGDPASRINCWQWRGLPNAPTPPRTNFDAITESPEKLADLLSELGYEGFCTERPDCIKALETDGISTDECKQCLVDWLNRAVDEQKKE